MKLKLTFIFFFLFSLEREKEIKYQKIVFDLFRRRKKLIHGNVIEMLIFVK
jgi:hypothetical protein